MSSPRLATEQIERARAVSIESELARRGIKLTGRIERVGSCPKCGGTDRFSINVKRQCWNCRGCKPTDIAGDVIGLVQWFDGGTFVEAVELLADDAHPRSVVEAHEQRRRDAGEDHHNVELAARIWHEARHIEGTPGALYFYKRGIDITLAVDFGGLRWHPRCPWVGGPVGCVIAQYTDAITSEPRGIWRRPIKRGEKPRTLGPMGGCVIRLWPDDAVTLGLVLGEGVETTLAAAINVEHRGALLQPAWAAGCAGNMANFPVLEGIEALTLLVDNDAGGIGQTAARQCAQRWAAAGREVTLLTPMHTGADFNDIVLE